MKRSLALLFLSFLFQSELAFSQEEHPVTESRSIQVSGKAESILPATGRDTRERKQYRYHPTWHELQAREKFDRLASVGKGLPRLRRRV